MGGSPPTNTTSTVTQTNLPDWLQGPVLDVVGRAQNVASEPYQPFPFERIAGFTPAEQQVQQNVLGMQAPNQFAFGSGLAASAGQQSLNMANQFQPGQFSSQQIGLPQLQQFQMGATRDVDAQQVNAPQMQGAQTSFGQGPLEQFRMQSPEMFGNEQAQQYMSPYMQNVVDVQKREAIRDAELGQLQTNLGAARQGTYGGSRQLMAGLERERQLGMNLSDIQARGTQSAFENAQQQFERDRSAGMSADQQNLGAALSQQQLGVQTGLQSALANLSNEQQARVNNQAMQFQSQGMNAENALRAALSNQGVDVARGQADLQSQLQTQQLGVDTGLRALLANQQAGLQTQQMEEQSRQFGAGQGLAALGQAGQFGQTLGNLGQMQMQTDLQRMQAQQQAAMQPRQLEQQRLDTMFDDFLRQRDFPMEQVGFLSNVIRGVPSTVNSASRTYAPPTSPMSVLGAGLGALGANQIIR